MGTCLPTCIFIFAGILLDPNAPPSFNLTRTSPAAGRIVCWGDNSRLQASPPQMRVIAIFAGALHSCAVTEEGGLLVCWGDKSISPRFRDGQRGPANPPEDFVVCANKPRHFELHHVGFRAISESFRHNVVDGASLLLLPAHASPFDTSFMILSPSYLVVSSAANSKANSTTQAPACLEVAVYRVASALSELREQRQRTSPTGEQADLRIAVKCYYERVGGRVAGGAALEVTAHGVGGVIAHAGAGAVLAKSLLSHP